jgi:uncharacterized protein (DUF1330 family)
MQLNKHFLIIWTDTDPIEDGLAEAARAHSGQLLAVGPIYDVSEWDSRPAPAGLIIARFATDQSARAWLDSVDDRFDGTAILANGATEPVWWPPEFEDYRPEWSRLADFPPDRMGQLVCVWAEITRRDEFLDYSVHYRWTVEYGGGVVLVPGRQPGQTVLRGGPAPDALALMAWPHDDRVRHAWYDGVQYRPYRDQRHRASRTTNVSVRALAPPSGSPRYPL